MNFAWIKAKRFHLILTLIMLLAFSGFTLLFVINRGICCADDAWYAVVAKNLASGRGYTSTLQNGPPVFRSIAFDPTVGTGPTSIFPAALFIKIFGNTYWAPGLSHVVLVTGLLALIGNRVYKWLGCSALPQMAGSFFFLNYALLAYHFTHWYTLLGEAPAALLLILGILIYRRGGARSLRFWSGVCFGLAVLAKMISLVAFGAFMIAVHFLLLFDSEDRHPELPQKYKRWILPCLAGFLIPLLFFETWKLIALGFSGWLDHWRSYTSFAFEFGITNPEVDLIHHVRLRMKVFQERFGVPFLSLPLIIALGGYIIRQDKNLLEKFLLLSWIVTVYSVWWMLFSSGTPRYYIIPLILVIFTVVLGFRSTDLEIPKYLYLMVLLLWSTFSWGRLGYPLQKIQGHLLKPNPRTRAMIETSELLSNYDGEKIVTQWWATAAGLEYMLDISLNFTTYRDDTLQPGKSYWIAFNQNFKLERRRFNQIIENCDNLQDYHSYTVGECIISR